MTININSLRKEYDVPGGVEVAVENVDLEIGDKEFLTLVGPSGCGKTTTLRCIAGLETPTSGQILFDGQDLTDVPANKRNLAMMFQNIALYPHMTIRDNIAYPLKVRGESIDVRDKEAAEAADIMQIPELLDKHPAELSGGQRQRAALARTIVQDPKAFLLDEPLSDLDAKLQVEIRKEIQRVHERVQRPTVYVTHNQEEAMTMSDRIAVMNDGRIEQVGSPDDLYVTPANTFVARFIGNPSMNFMQGEIVSRDGDEYVIDLHGEEVSVTAATVTEKSPGADVIVGIRPESIELDEDGYFEGDVEIVERIGDRMQATLSGPEGEIRAVVPAENTLSRDQTVSIGFDGSEIHLFDGSTHDAIAHGVNTT